MQDTAKSSQWLKVIKNCFATGFSLLAPAAQNRLQNDGESDSRVTFPGCTKFVSPFLAGGP